ncbi:MAG: sulfurtransferase TusA family protein [Actinomycetaceae bacterium]|nr:sulfurtransferase TusA family protein [Actinomycetaceae bacterium]
MNFIKLKRKDKPEPVAVETEPGTGSKYVLDTIGQVCPFPLVEAKRAIEPLNSGDELKIDFDCTQATDSIPAWAADNGHAVTDFRQLDEATWTITVRKA